MHAEHDVVPALSDLFAPTTGTADTYATVARGSFTPPRLEAVATSSAARAPRLTIADLRLPAELVRERADRYAQAARERGAQHSLRIWRVAFEQALVALSCEATHAPAGTTCEALFWQQEGDEYHISITLGQPRQALLH
jgi:hypothetical protein